MNNVVHYMHDLLAASVPPPFELWVFYWKQSPLVQYLAAGLYMTTIIDSDFDPPESSLSDLIRFVPFPAFREFFRKYGRNVLLSPSATAMAVSGNFWFLFFIFKF